MLHQTLWDLLLRKASRFVVRDYIEVFFVLAFTYHFNSPKSIGYKCIDFIK